MVQRLTYRRRHGFRTKSNKVRKVKTPGGKLVFQYLTKKSNVPKCGDCGLELQGIPAVRPKVYRSLHKRERRVSRAYGGSRCATCVRQRSATSQHIDDTSAHRYLHLAARSAPVGTCSLSAPPSSSACRALQPSHYSRCKLLLVSATARTSARIAARNVR